MGGSSKAQTVGYKYYLGMHAIMCHGPVDKVTRFSVDGKVAWSGTSTGGAVSVNAPQLFGGDEREGGVSGTIDIEMGTTTQGRNAYLQSQLGSSIPAFRRVLGLVFRQCYLGNNPYLKRWAIRATRILVRQDGIAQWYSAKADVGGDMNPAHIIREVLTDPDWGMGYPEADVDNASFTAAADTLYSEGMGMSILWDKQQQLSDFLAIVLRHVDGSLYTDRATGKFVLKLARGGYDIPSLLLLDESVVERVTDFKRSTVAELTNQVSVVYWDKSTGKNNSVTVQDIALAASQGATVGTTSQYPGFTNGTIATKAAARDLKALSTPLASATLYVTRKAASLNIGDVFRFAWAEYGISQVVFRVTNIELGELTSNLIKLSVVEDVFALSSAIYSPPPPSEWTNPIGAPVPVPFRLLTEVPYYLIARTLGDSGAQALPQTASYMMVGGTNPGGSAYSAQVYVDEGAGYQQQAVANFCPTAVISAAYGQADTALAITGGLDLDLVQVGDVAAIGVGAISTSEMVQVVSITDTLLTVKRGMLDTVPAPIASNTRVIFLGSGDNPSVVELPNEYALGESVSVRMLTTTGQGTLALGSGATDTLAINATAGRQWRPYPPGLFRVNGMAYPASIPGNQNITVSWAHRDRLQQTAQTLVDQNASNIGPEAGTTYTCRVLKQDGTVIATHDLLTGTTTTFTYSPAFIPSSHVYWRLRFSAGMSGGDIWLDEVSFRDASNTDLSIGGTATSSGNYSASYTPNLAFDKTTSTNGWASNTIPCWIAYQHTAAVTVAKVIVTCANEASASDELPVDGAVFLEYSDTGTTWTTAAELARESGTWTPGSVVTLSPVVSSELGSNFGKLKVQLWSVRSGVQSLQMHELEFIRPGYGAEYGNYYGGV